ncbi:MAG: tRNA uridine-5-carboxymethylaminomethyl(34) synthesis GTPase MnmE [Gammaproteobacteria bacterium]|nr:tRNA uridine-5-carboxymethylaminomethyl(34) synthesis GTPase MnmE [Gammaproteobacteria bacterium]
MLKNDTIVAQATPKGFGGVAIVRVSGPQVKSIATLLTGQPLPPRQATLRTFLAADGETIDTGIALFFPGPQSFTGEDVLELQGHGGPIVVDLIIESVLHAGARLAEPGEFSERAFLNGKIDLAQAEAIADLIQANSKEATRAAQRTLQGEFSHAIFSLQEKILSLRIYLEASIDFSDEEIDFLKDENILQRWHVILAELDQLQIKSHQGSLLREGINIVIAGRPNVGKSSLLNALSCKAVAIVTSIPGTTRDVMRQSILIDGIPLHIIDTAGLRDSTDEIEQEGIRRAHDEIKQADLILHVIDRDSSLDDWKMEQANCPILLIQNKIDLTPHEPFVQTLKDQVIIHLSAKTGAGLTLLKNEIKRCIGWQPQEASGSFYARRRHLEALVQTKKHVLTGLEQLAHHHSIELSAEELRLAHLALATITGEITSDDLLGHIFSNFCIGK